MNTYLARFSIPVEQKHHYPRIKDLAEHCVSMEFHDHAALVEWLQQKLERPDVFQVVQTSTGATVGLLGTRVLLITFVILT